MQRRSIRFDDRPGPGASARYAAHEAAAAARSDAGVCRIVRENLYHWLDDLAASHAQLGERVTAQAPGWFYTRLSRLDARPWGNSDIIKPLFFARAVIAWLEANPEAGDVTLVGAPPAVARYLERAQTAQDFAVETPGKAGAPGTPRSGRGIAPFVLKMLLRHLLRSSPGLGQASVLALYQPVAGQDLDDGYRFYFTSLLDDVPVDRLCIAALGMQPARRKGNRAKPVLDAVTVQDMVAASRAVRAFGRALDEALAQDAPCTLGGVTFAGFWRDYSAALYDPAELFEAACTRACLERFAARGKVRTVLYPYEEKGIERAILHAADTASWKTIGFTPHAQHRLNIAMQDRPDSSCPKPGAYAFCGDGYPDFFRGWGNKRGADMAVWGSAKSAKPFVAPEIPAGRKRLNVLFAVSHPVEVDMFRAWLNMMPELSSLACFRVRRYRATGPTLFDEPMARLRAEHPGVEETSGTLEEDIAACDAVLFCGTSAGPEAANMGRLAIYADLNDVFPINPMFDDVSEMLPCRDPQTLCDRLRALPAMSAREQRSLHERQLAAARNCFAPVQPAAIAKALS